MHWLNLLSDSIRGVGLTADEVEPCIYQGVVNGELALPVAYVDDLLLCCQSEKAEKIVEKALERDRNYPPCTHGGGRLIFIGRHVHRGLDDDSLTIGVDPKFLDTTFTEFNITKGSASVPDVAGILDKAMGDKNQLQEPSPSAYSRFRRAFGKLLWMAQSRHDLKPYLSLIGSQQAKPNQGTESAIRAWLRFLFEDVGTCLRLPSPEYENLMIGPARHSILHSFSDASFAPYRFNGRKGISGGVVFCEGYCIESHLPKSRGPVSCNQATDNSAADASSSKGLTMSKALVVVLAPYFTFMRRFQFFPSMSHIPGHLNELADEQSRFKQPLSVNLDPMGFRDIPWQEQDLLRLLGVFVTQHGRKWFLHLDIQHCQKELRQSADWGLQSVNFWGLHSRVGRFSIRFGALGTLHLLYFDFNKPRHLGLFGRVVRWCLSLRSGSSCT